MSQLKLVFGTFIYLFSSNYLWNLFKRFISGSTKRQMQLKKDKRLKKGTNANE
jgi:hypothetical protein